MNVQRYFPLLLSLSLLLIPVRLSWADTFAPSGITPEHSCSEEPDWSEWNAAIPIELTDRDPETAEALPVDVTFAVFADQIQDPYRELRLIRRSGQECQEVPFQLWNVGIREQDTDGESSRRTLTGTITFFDESEETENGEYLLLYGNSQAEAPEYPTDLSVTGDAPELTIENSQMRVTLHPSGQLASVKPAGADGVIEAPPGVIHWNPGVFIPTRYWAHAWDWDPPQVVEVDSGPLFVKLKRSGTMPEFPELKLSITYRFFSDRPYVESSTRMELDEDLGVVALRNDQLVFDPSLFDHFAWEDRAGEVHSGAFEEHDPVNDHGDIFRIRPDAGFIAFYGEEQGLGAATIRLEALNSGPAADPPVLFDHASYITKAGELYYWFRPLVYFHVDWSRQKLITVPRGSIYTERNLYLFFQPGQGDPLSDVRHYRRAADFKPLINIGEYRLPPLRDE